MKGFLRTLWLFSGILLIVCGVYVLFHPEQTLTNIAALLGIATLLSGIFSTAAYFTQKDELFGANGMLLSSILDIILGILLLIYPVSAFIANIFLICMSLWILSKGIAAIFQSILAKDFDSHWYVMLIIGILLALFGILSLIKPIIAALTVSIAVAIFLLSDGIEIVGHWWMIRKFRQSIGL